VLLEGGHEAGDIAAGLQFQRLAAGEGDGQRPPGLGDLRADRGDAGDFYGAQMIMDLAEHGVGGPYVQRFGLEAQDDRGIQRHAYLRNTLELTDGNLSRNISRLQDAGYVRIEKVAEGRRSRTRLSATPAGRAALNAEIAALREIIAGLDAPPTRQRARQPLTGPA